VATSADELNAALETQRLRNVQQASDAAVAQDPGLPQRVSDIAKAAPFLPPGIVTSLAKAQQTPTDATTTTAAQRSYQQALLSWDPLKATSRAVLTGLSAPWQEVQGLQRDAIAYGDQLGGSPGKALGGTLAGAGTGALAGGLVGSVVPVIGTGIGAAVGGLIGGVAGFFGSRDVAVKKGFQYQSQSALGIELGDLLKGKPVNAGSGFFANGEVAAEQLRRAQDVTVDGKPYTGGRLIVAGIPDNIVEPGTRPYRILSGLVDAAAIVEGDPAQLGLSAAGGAIKATRYFGEAGSEVSRAGALSAFGSNVAEKLGAGIVNGLRQETIPEQTARWLDSGAGQRVLQAIDNADNAATIWKGLGKQAPFEVAAKLGDAKGDPQAIRNILDGELGTTVRQKPTWGSFGSTLVRKATLGYVDPFTNRLMPNFGPLSKDNPDQALEQFDRLLSAGRVSPDATARHLDNLGRAMLDTPGDWSSKAVNALTGGLKDVYNNILARQGSDPLTREAAAEVTGLFNSSKTASGYLVDELGHNASPFEMQINGRGIQVPRPHSFLEHTAGQVWLPNARDIARNTSRFANILTNPAVQATGEALRFVSGQIWKPLEILKMGTGLRILADTQESMDARGLSSLFSSPMDLLGWAVGQSDSKVSSVLGKLVESRGSTDALGELMADHAEFAATSGSVRRLLDPVGQARSSGRMLFQNGQAQFARVWADEVNHLALDPIHTAAARMSEADFTNWLDTGVGAKYREAMVSPTKAELSTLNPDYRTNLGRYVDSVYQRLDKATQNDADLRAIIQRGAKGEAISGGPEGVRPAIDKAVARLYAEVDSQGQHTFAPNFLTGYMEGGPEAEAKANKLKVARDWMVDHMMTMPLNFFTNHPAYAQTYWREIDRLYPLMDEASQAEVAANAAKANVTLANLGTTEAGSLSAEEANVVAKGHVVVDVKGVIHNLSDRSQLADKLSVVAPFFDAFQKIASRWAGALWENPEYLRKLQMVQQAGADSGFLHQNDYGQEVFSFPLSQWATRTVTGLPVDIQGDPSRGLPLVHSLLPSIGPALSIPLGALIKDKPGWEQSARDFLNLGTGGGITPNWLMSMKRAFSPADPQTDRTYLNAVKNAMRYTAYEHPQQYDLGTNTGQAALIHDSKLRASGIFMVQMLGQFFSPAGSNLVDMTRDPQGHWITATALSRDFQARKTAMGTSDAAVQSMLNDYGDSVFLYLQSPNQTAVPGAPTTRSASDWIKANPAVKDAYPDLYALLAPAQGAFDPGVYAQSFQDGQRVNLTPQQFIQLGEARLGNLIYAQASATAGTRRTPAVNMALSTLRQALADKYPGYGKTVGKTVDWTSAEPQIEAAVQDPTVLATAAGQGLAQYWEVRTAAMTALNANGLTSFSGKRAAPIAQVMQDTAGAIAANNPDFAALYDWVLSLEIPKPKATVQAPASSVTPTPALSGAVPPVPVG
jgi:hypothetical protein